MDKLQRFIPGALILAGIANIGGVLIFSKGFQDPVLSSHYPSVFSTFGLLAICLWGLAYISVAKSYKSVPNLMLVFFVEKLCYVATAVIWWSQYGSSIELIFSESIMAGIFYIIYGLNDLLFAAVFLTAYFVAKKSA